MMCSKSSDPNPARRLVAACAALLTALSLFGCETGESEADSDLDSTQASASGDATETAVFALG